MKQDGADFAQRHGEKLYHYTTLAALMGMLESRTFWLGNVASMNDRSEARDFIGKLREAVGEEKSEQAFSLISRKLEDSYPFAMSLTTLREDAAQWERYAKGAKGVCLVLNSRRLFDVLHGSENLVFQEVSYEYDIAQNPFCALMSEYIKSGSTGRYESFDELAQELILAANLHKNRSFASEDEIRVLAANPLPKMASVGFKYMDGVIRQICELRVGELCEARGMEFEELFDEVIIGPRSYQRPFDLQGYIASLGYLRLQDRVGVSNCPLR